MHCLTYYYVYNDPSRYHHVFLKPQKVMLKKVDSPKGDMCMGLGLFLWTVRPGNFASLGNGFSFCFFSPELGR